MRTAIRPVFLGLVVAGLALFILQNREVLELRFLGWEFQTRRAYMLMAVFASGFVSGWVVATVAQLGRRSREEIATHPPHHKAPPSH